MTDVIRARPLIFLFGLAAVSLLGLLLVPPIPQSQTYHRFADQRTLLGIPNFWNVVSNLPFILVGALGLARVRGNLSASMFFLGVFLTGFGSSYYHWRPDDSGLFWDRLPMSFAFMATLAYVIEERIDERVGRLLLWPLIAARHRQPADLAQGRRSAALRLGAVLSLRGAAADVLAVRAEVQRHGVLVCRRGTLHARQAAGALRRRDLFGDRPSYERPSAQARRRGRRLLTVYLVFTGDSRSGNAIGAACSLYLSHRERSAAVARRAKADG